MPIKATFRLTEKRKVFDKDTQPVYVFEAIKTKDDDDDHFAKDQPLGKIKLRVTKKKAQEELTLGDRYIVEITKRKK